MANLYLLSIADTNDTSAGRYFANNAAAVKSLASAIRNITGLAGEDTEISGAAFSAAKIGEVVDNLNVRTDDVVIFYYSGHGLSPKNSEFPSFECPPHPPKSDPPNLEDLAKRIAKKSPKVALCIADCCNVIVTPPHDRDVVARSGARVDSEQERAAEETRNTKIRTMFLNSSGAILLASARKGEKAIYEPDGGKFTQVLTKLLRDPPDPEARFGDLWQTTIAKVTEKISSLDPDRPTKKIFQTPQCAGTLQCELALAAAQPMSVMASLSAAQTLAGSPEPAAAAAAPPSLFARLFGGWGSGAKG